MHDCVQLFLFHWPRLSDSLVRQADLVQVGASQRANALMAMASAPGVGASGGGRPERDGALTQVEIPTHEAWYRVEQLGEDGDR